MSNEVYQAFMVGYVRRLNAATLNVTFGGVRIGSAKYSRLAQINLHSRIITFSRYAIENVPERGRRYLVIHELAHVKEPSHNKKFWDIVGTYEPNYKQIGKELEIAFKRNVRAEQSKNTMSGNSSMVRLQNPKLLLSSQSETLQDVHRKQQPEWDLESDEVGEGNCFDCNEDEFGSWADSVSGIICGGSEKTEMSNP